VAAPGPEHDNLHALLAQRFVTVSDDRATLSLLKKKRSVRALSQGISLSLHMIVGDTFKQVLMWWHKAQHDTRKLCWIRTV
jgi:hypothetical protein